MKGFSLSAAVNASLSGISVFFILCYPFSLVLNRALTIFFSVVLSVFLSFIIYRFSYDREKKKNDSKFINDAFNQRMNILYACTDEEISAILKALLIKLHICADVSGRHMQTEDGSIVLFLLLPTAITANELAFFLRNFPYREKKIKIVSSSFSTEAEKFAEFAGVTLVDGVEFGKILEENDLLPEFEIKKKKADLRERISPFFYKTNGKRFLFYAALLGLFSRFSFYPIYYVISSLIFAIYGLIAVFFGKTASLKSKELF